MTTQILSCLMGSNNDQFNEAIEIDFRNLIDLNFDQLKKVFLYNINAVRTGYGRYIYTLQIDFHFDFGKVSEYYDWINNDSETFNLLNSLDYASLEYNELMYNIAFEIIHNNISLINEEISNNINEYIL